MSAPHTPDSPLPAPPVPPAAPPPPVPAAGKRESIWRVSEGDIPWPVVDDVIIDDGEPVDNIFSERQMRLLVEALYISWTGRPAGAPFLALANVGLFNWYGLPPVVPDVLLTLGISQPTDLSIKDNLSYFVWRRGKVPDVVIEVVSNREGGEDGDKVRTYESIRVPYYVIYDPENKLRGGLVRAWGLVRTHYEPTDVRWMDDIGLGLTLWEGTFEGVAATWLRWCDKDGVVLPTGAERSEKAEEQAKKAEEQAKKAEDDRKKAEEQANKADERAKKADDERKQAEDRAARLAEKLRAAGIDPDADGD